jgi:hypothetical protein
MRNNITGEKYVVMLYYGQFFPNNNNNNCKSNKTHIIKLYTERIKDKNKPAPDLI